MHSENVEIEIELPDVRRFAVTRGIERRVRLRLILNCPSDASVRSAAARLNLQWRQVRAELGSLGLPEREWAASTRAGDARSRRAVAAICLLQGRRRLLSIAGSCPPRNLG